MLPRGSTTGRGLDRRRRDPLPAATRIVQKAFTDEVWR
ncbi:hypothetical protein SAMN05421541_13338 [Actinoplanes philippinensis]|uniref:Uncharacterized protein n=1 Tax=Actinoplanes philippinensis TaxID=35752 RepID=A0A1I2MU84_9ACTN|nr:hypothetical protein SAMN05421541_13338 [Actinoplanes philippinensis]